MVRLIFYNIEYLEGLDGKKLEYLEFWRRVIHPKDIEKKIASALKEYDPDIVAFAEVGSKSFIEGDYLSHIQKELGMRHHLRRKKYDLRGKFNLIKEIPFMNGQANAILSKGKLSDVKTIYLHEGIKRTVILVDVDLGVKIAILVVHLSLGEKIRKAQIEELVGIVKEVKMPVILAGDFNTFNGEREIKSLLTKAALHHDFRIHGGRVFTYPTFHPRRRLDYILTSRDIRVKDYRVLKVPFSDHLPILIDFEVKIR